MNNGPTLLCGLQHFSGCQCIKATSTHTTHTHAWLASRLAAMPCHAALPAAAAAAARSHPEEVRKFYALVDEFHRMWDVVTEFDSLSNLATQMVPVSGSLVGRQGWRAGVFREARVLLEQQCWAATMM